MHALLAIAVVAAISLATLPILIILTSIGMIADVTAYNIGFCSVVIFVLCLPMTIAATLIDYTIGLIWRKL